jgi:SPP1 gp7 family putative phage head morphogenesis protein
VEGVIGFLSDGSPLQALLNELGPDAAERVGNALTQGVILGQSPAQIARLARRALGGNAARAMLISRDAVIRSYQETTHQNYLANAATVAGWRWWASLGSRACASCVSLHGTLHPLTERLREHPGGRCTQVPVVKGEPEPAFQTGPEWFAEQPVSVQRAIVGPAKLGALQSGDIAPEDLSIRRRSRRWGAHFTEATYAEALASADARRTRGGTA